MNKPKIWSLADMANRNHQHPVHHSMAGDPSHVTQHLQQHPASAASVAHGGLHPHASIHSAAAMAQLGFSAPFGPLSQAFSLRTPPFLPASAPAAGQY